jgi:hypothetical protein
MPDFFHEPDQHARHNAITVKLGRAGITPNPATPARPAGEAGASGCQAGKGGGSRQQINKWPPIRPRPAPRRRETPAQMPKNQKINPGTVHYLRFAAK